MPKIWADYDIVNSIKEKPLTQMEIAEKLGCFWDSGIGRRLRNLTKKGEITRQKIGKKYYYSALTQQVSKEAKA